MRSLTISLLAAAVTAAAAPGDGAGSARVADPAVRILWQQARWATLGGPDELGNSSDSVFVVSGEILNASPRTIWAVKLHYELLDEMHGRVASEYVYNRSAEDLRRADYENGTV